jgi:hypothetical protein
MPLQPIVLPPAIEFQIRARVQTAFPKLATEPFEILGPPADTYNCIAWAAGDTSRWWCPRLYWPSGVVRSMAPNALMAALATVGYTRCADESLQEGLEKIAIFLLNGTAMHAARQLVDGRWTSKLGRSALISHGFNSLDGSPAYGSVAFRLRRPRPM